MVLLAVDWQRVSAACGAFLAWYDAASTLEEAAMNTAQLLICKLTAVGIARAQTVTETVLHNFGIFTCGGGPSGSSRFSI